MVVRYALDGTPDRSQAREPREGVFPRRRTKTAFMDTWVSASLSTARYGAVMKAMKDSSDGDVIYCYERYSGAKYFDKAMTESLTSTLVSNSIMTSNERTALLNAWPKD